MRELPHFKFHPSEWLNGDIVMQEPATQAVFINLCALWWHKDGEIPYDVEKISRYIRIDKDTVRIALGNLIDSCLVTQSESNIEIKFLRSQFDELYEGYKKKSDGGKKGAHLKALKKLQNMRRNEAKPKDTLKDTLKDSYKDTDKGCEGIKSKRDINNKSNNKNKTLHGEFVLLTEDEKKRLDKKYGKDITDGAIEFLNHHLADNPKYLKEHTSHNSCIHKWVITAYKEKLARDKKSDLVLGNNKPSGPIYHRNIIPLTQEIEPDDINL